MRQFAVIDMRTKWILSLHAERGLAENRLRSYVNGILEGSRESLERVERHLSGEGPGLKDAVPHMRVVGVDGTAKRRAFYDGPIFESKPAVRRKSA